MRRGQWILMVVVVGVIAILIAIILPALSQARQRARTAGCAANERALAQCLQTYMQDWGGVNRGLWTGSALSLSQQSEYWDYRILGIGSEFSDWDKNDGRRARADRVRYCPESPVIVSLMKGFYGSAHEQWNRPLTLDGRTHSGSYGLNLYLTTFGGFNWPAADGAIGPASMVRYSQSQNLEKQSSIVPAFVDCAWLLFGPFPDDPVPQHLDDSTDVGITLAHDAPMSLACMNRHRMAVIVAFFDGHVETVKLGSLWAQKWSGNWPRTEPAVVSGK